MHPLPLCAAAATGGSAPPFTPDFGDGSDGNLTVGNGQTVYLTTQLGADRDAKFNNLTVTGTGKLIVNKGYRIFVKTLLDISSCSARAITCGGPDETATAAVADGTVGGSGGGTAGGAGGTPGGGAQAAAPSNLANSNGGKGGKGNTAGAGGPGWSGGPTTPGPSRSGGTVAGSLADPLISDDFMAWPTTAPLRKGGAGGAGGGGGQAGRSFDPGPSGGSGWGGGGVLVIYAKTINRDATNTAAGAISAKGGVGVVGNADSVSRDYPCSPGGGGGGGGGGWIYIVYESLTGTAKAGALDASGGNAGAGGLAYVSTTHSPTEDAFGGYGGDGGDGGRITLIDTTADTVTTTNGAAGSAGGAPVNQTGGSAGGGGACTSTL